MTAPIGHREVVSLSWPIMVSMLSYTAITVADSIFVGRLGTTELAAIGVSASIIHLGTSLGMGLLSGMRVAVAKSWGARQQALARRYAWQGIWLAGAVGLVVAALAPFGWPAFLAMGASEPVAAAAVDYYAPRVIAAPLLFLSVALSAWFQGRGDTRTPMVANVVANVANVVLDPLLIFGLGGLPGMGIAGAAWATNVGLLVGLGILVGASYRELAHRVSAPSLALLRPIVRVGLPKVAEHLLEVSSFVVFSALLARAGDEHLAAHVVAVRIALVSFLPGYAIAEAAGVLVGQRLGAGRPDQARAAHRAATHLAVGFMLACGLVFVAVPGPLIAVFGAEAEVHRLAVQVLVAIAALQLFDALATVAAGALTGAGDTRYVLASTVIAAWAVKVPVAVVLVGSLGMGVLGAWIGVGAEIAVMAALCTWRIQGDAWLDQGLDRIPVPAK